MMKRRATPIVAAALAVSGCNSPEISVFSIEQRTFTITNRGDSELRIERVVANDGDGRAECEQAPGVVLGPGRSHSLTFFDCGQVDELEIHTDWGEYDLEWDVGSNSFR